MKKDLSKLYTVTPSDPNNPQGIREYFQRIIDAMPNNVYWLDRNCITLGCNRNILRLIGLERLEDFVGISYEQMGKLANWTEGQAESFKRDDMEVMSTGEAKYNVEEPPLYDEKGNPIYYMSSRVPLFDENNNVIGVVGISVDITHRKALEEKLRNTEVSEARFKAISALGGMIAHELRTPLTTIGMGILPIQNLLPQLLEGYEKSVIRGEAPPIPDRLFEGMKKSMDLAARAVKYAQTTITTILTGFHYSDTSVQINRTPFSLKSMIVEAIAEYPFNIEEEQLINIKHIDDVQVLGEEQMVVHVLYNLLKNALHAIHEEKRGAIFIWTELDKDKVYFYVEDTAKGIKKEELSRLFESFYTTKQKAAVSIGLGLYFCKMALKKMAADITCESEFGKFTRFKITLALAKK